MKNNAPDVGSYEAMIAQYKNSKTEAENARLTVVKLTEIIFRTVEDDIRNGLGPDYRLDEWSVGDSVMGNGAFRNINFGGISVLGKDKKYALLDEEGDLDEEIVSDILKRINEQVKFLKKYNIEITFPYYLFDK